MILLLGGSGYVGSVFRKLPDERGLDYRSISRRDHDYTNKSVLVQLIGQSRATFLINAAGYTGKPNVDACETQKAESLLGNAVLPGVIHEACETCELPWGHVSSGCIYTGSKPGNRGFTEADVPNFCFRTNNCSFYSGCKPIGEECLEGAESCYIWRLRIPFNSQDSTRNYLSKLMRYDRLLVARTSLSHLDECAGAALDCWQQRVPPGTHNVTNPGSITTREIVAVIHRELDSSKQFQFFELEAEFMRLAAIRPPLDCVLDSSKLRSIGIEMSNVEDAIRTSHRSWELSKR